MHFNQQSEQNRSNGSNNDFMQNQIPTPKLEYTYAFQSNTQQQNEQNRSKEAIMTWN